LTDYRICLTEQERADIESRLISIEVAIKQIREIWVNAKKEIEN
jgi:hypothetical protein